MINSMVPHGFMAELILRNVESPEGAALEGEACFFGSFLFMPFVFPF